MPGPSSLPEFPNLDFEKKQAKALLRACRTGDADALARMRAQVPRLGDRPTLSDAQFVIARERGFDSWPKLKAHIRSAQPIEQQVARFLEAIRDRKVGAARRVLAEFPALTSTNIHAAAAAADLEAVTNVVARDPALAVAPDAQDAPWTPLLYACWSGFHKTSAQIAAASVRVVEILLNHGADVNSATFVENDPKAPLSALYFACESDNVAVVRLLLDRGAQPNDGESVYHAAQHNHRACLDELLAHGADIGARHAHWNNTPLFFLAGHQSDDDGRAAWLQGMGWLLDHGADPNVTSGSKAETPLHLLVRSPRTLAAATRLVEAGANVNQPRADGRTPCAIAMRKGNDPGAHMLRAHGADDRAIDPLDRLLGALARGDEAEARRLADDQPGWRDRLSPEDRDLLADVAEEGRLDAMRVMVALGFDPAGLTEAGETPLHRAAWHGRADAVQFLLDLGAPVNIRDRTFGSSPLGWAAHGSTNCRRADDEYFATIERLLAAGADYESSINRWGVPPVNMASPRVAALLIARGHPK